MNEFNSKTWFQTCLTNKIFFEKKICHFALYPSSPSYPLQLVTAETNIFFRVVCAHRTKIIRKDNHAPHTPCGLSQMYHNWYTPVFASVPIDKIKKKFKSLLFRNNNPSVKSTISAHLVGGCKSISGLSERKNRKQHTTT